MLCIMLIDELFYSNRKVFLKKCKKRNAIPVETVYNSPSVQREPLRGTILHSLVHRRISMKETVDFQ